MPREWTCSSCCVMPINPPSSTLAMSQIGSKDHERFFGVVKEEEIWRFYLRKGHPQVKRDATVIEQFSTSPDWWCPRRHSFVHLVLMSPRRFHLDLEVDRRWRIVTNSYWARALDLDVIAWTDCIAREQWNYRNFRYAKFSQILCSVEWLPLHRQWHQRQSAFEESCPSASRHRNKPISLHSSS